MKNLIILLTVSFFILGSCKKGALVQDLEKCNLTGNLISVENKEGTLFYTDTVPGFKFQKPYYFIINLKLDIVYDSIYLPLNPCNLPEENFKSISLGDSVRVKFSGIIQLLPPTVDAASLVLELNKIELLNH